MRIWTVHTRAADAPVLVREGFSLGAFLFGPLWLAAHRAWIAAVLSFCLFLLIGFAPQLTQPILALALAVLLGLNGRDLQRWALARRRYTLVHVVSAPNGDQALGRLLHRRPDLAGPFLPAAQAPRGA